MSRYLLMCAVEMALASLVVLTWQLISPVVALALLNQVMA